MSGSSFLSSVYAHAPQIERRIRDLDAMAARPRPGDRTPGGGARHGAFEERVELIGLFARAYLPATGEGSALVIRLTGFLRGHEAEFPPELLDALATRLDPRAGADVEERAWTADRLRKRAPNRRAQASPAPESHCRW